MLQLDDQSVALRPDVGVDLIALRRRCLDAIRTQRVDDALGNHPALLEELCSDIDGEWAGLERERWRQLRLHVLVLYLKSLRGLGRELRLLQNWSGRRAWLGAIAESDLIERSRSFFRKCAKMRPGLDFPPDFRSDAYFFAHSWMW